MSYARMDFLTDYHPKSRGIISFVFALEDKSGSLSNALNVFNKHGISLKHIESRPSRNFEWEHEFLVELSTPPAEVIESIKNGLCSIAKNVQLIGEIPDAEEKGTLQIYLSDYG